MARQIEEPGPFRLSEIHGPRRTVTERHLAAQVLRRHGVNSRTSAFQLVRIPALELIESLILEACEDGRSTFDYASWRKQGGPEGPLREVWAQADEMRRVSPEHRPRVEELQRLYAEGVDVDPLIALPLDAVLPSGERAVVVLDGRHRVFAAVAAGVEVLPVYLLIV